MLILKNNFLKKIINIYFFKKIINIYFNKKNYLKNNHNYTVKQAFKAYNHILNLT